MKLQNVLTFRLSVLKAIAIALWAVCFYFAIIKEINNKTDDSLTNYAESLITDYLAGMPLPDTHNGSGNNYYIHAVSDEYAEKHSHIRYRDMDTYVTDDNKFEQTRAVTYIFKDNNDKFHELTVFTPTIDKQNLKNSIFIWLIVLFFGLLAGIIIVNIWTVSHSMRPLKRLFGWLDAYKLGKNIKPLENNTRITEFRKLNETVMRSIERNERQYEQQKLFIANASHEMQTPLAVCRNRLEMLLDDEGLTEEQMAEIIKTLHTLKELTETNRSLLLLCKIDNGQFASVKPVSLKEVTAQAVNNLKPVYSRMKITVNNMCEEAPVIDMDESLAVVLMTNLIKNAFVHNIQGGEINITSDREHIKIENTGQADKLDSDKIFERFYHSPGKKSSTGLGLAIVKAICAQYGMDVTYTFNNGKHAFEISKCKK